MSSDQANSDFLNRLGNELIRQQDRRAEHVKSKFSFVIALAGLVGALQSIKMADPMAVNLIIYGIPLVAALFDLYILGGDFAVKRIRSFLIAQDLAGTGEARWARHIDLWPKDFMRHNRRMTTGFVTVACATVAAGNLYVFRSARGQWLLWAGWLAAVTAINAYLIHIESVTRSQLAATAVRAAADRGAEQVVVHAGEERAVAPEKLTALTLDPAPPTPPAPPSS